MTATPMAPNGTVGCGVMMRGVAAAFPPRRVDGAEVERMIRSHSPGVRLPDGVIATVSGVRERRYAGEGIFASDLAAEAGRRVLAETGTPAAAVDLLIFAAASQDLAEPATANIVQEKVGTRAAVFDLKNACNSFLNTVQVAEGLIRAGMYRTVLITTGEIPSRSVRWQAENRAEVQENFPGYTLGDAGAAALLTPAEDGRGIFYRAFRTMSAHWGLATIPGGGTMYPRGDEHTYIRGDGAALKRAFAADGPGIIRHALREAGMTYNDFAAILVHQVSLPYLREFMATTGIPPEKVVVTLPQYGNMAAASLPVAFTLAQEAGRIRPGDRVLWIGLAAGISIGVLMMQC